MKAEFFKLERLILYLFSSVLYSLYAQPLIENTDKSLGVKSPEGLIDIIEAPNEIFKGKIFFINDFDGGDKDNQNVAEELNRNSKIKNSVIVLSYLPSKTPRKVEVIDLVKDVSVLSTASKKGRVAIAMGAHSRHVLTWLTKLDADEYNFNNIFLVTHSNWNELDGRAGYTKNKKPGDIELKDTHGIDLRRGLYVNLAKIADLGVTIWEIPRTDMGLGGWGGKIPKSKGDVSVKTLDISDLGLIHYLKTGITQASTTQRNDYVSDILQKPEKVSMLKSSLILRYWDSNRGIKGKMEDYQEGGKFYMK